MTENKPSSLFERFDAHRGRYVTLAIVLYLFINNTINATSVWMENTRGGSTPPFQLWEPFAWEYTSAITVLVLLPVMFFGVRHVPLKLSSFGRFAVIHLVFSLLFALAHVAAMVALRKAIYLSQGMTYEFGHWGTEFFYEYRKDLWGYLFWLLVYHLYHFVYARLKGEAQIVAESEETPDTATPEHLIVKKLDKEFLVKVDDIEWLESAGNYVNLHSQGRIYPLRATLNKLLPILEPKGFSRVHRSYGVNHQRIESINSLPSGDGQLTLIGGHSLPLSRRYKDAFKQKLTP